MTTDYDTDFTAEDVDVAFKVAVADEDPRLLEMVLASDPELEAGYQQFCADSMKLDA